MHGARELFATRRLRCTRQRLAIYEALRRCTDHPTAEELYRLVRPGSQRLSLATVYNTLEALCDAGLCRRLPATHGCCRYDADTSEHIHLRFRDSGHIRDVPPDLGLPLVDGLPQSVVQEIERRMGVRVDGISIQLLASVIDRS
jgi:Fe2+ or Zn2+ uptake regulation protein